MKVELTVGDVIFLLDTFKVLNNIIEGKEFVEVEELVLECEKLLNEKMEVNTDDAIAEFRRITADVRWRKA